MQRLTILLVLFAACGASESEGTADGWQVFGAPVADGEWTQASAVMAKPGDFDGKQLSLEGEVAGVCKKKGCWMTMRDGEKQMRVTFKDYGFFVPKDCEGRTVRMEGVFAVKMIPEADAKHYLEDAGKHEEAAKLKGDQKELTFVANGVRLSP